MKISGQGKGKENCFMGMECGEHAHVVILPVLFDKTSSYKSGSDKGPIALIHASRNIELYDIETDRVPYKDDIHTAEPVQSFESLDMIEKVHAECQRLLQRGKFIVTLGGEHTISLGAIKAHAEHFGPLSILQIDAHTDLVDEYEDNKYSHACVMKRVKELDNIVNVVAVGIRSMAQEEKNNLERSELFYAHELVGDQWILDVLDKLHDNVYISFDLDGLDSSVMPSTGTPEPGGLSWSQAISLIRSVIELRNVIGLDVVELCPLEGFHAPDYTAAKIVFKALAYKYAKGEK